MHKQSLKVFIYKFTASKYFNGFKINYFWSEIGLKFKQNVKVLIGFKIDKKNIIRNPIFFVYPRNSESVKGIERTHAYFKC